MKIAVRKIMVVAVLFALLFSGIALIFVDSNDVSAAEGDQILFDMGNGSTTWCYSEAKTGETLNDVFLRVAEANDITYSLESGVVTVNGVTTTTVGVGSGEGSFINSGTTVHKTTSTWILYKWDGEKKEWSSIDASLLLEPYVDGHYALGFYPAGIVPVETPEDNTSWVMIRGNAQQTGNQTVTYSTEEPAEVVWTDTRGGVSGVYSAVLYAQGLVFVKFGTSSGMGTQAIPAALNCYTFDGEKKWSFTFPGILYYETVTPLILGDYIYVNSGLGYIFKLPWKVGPGENNENVTTFNNTPYNDLDIEEKEGAIPYETGAELIGKEWSTGCGNLIYDSGTIYCNASNGMVYAFDTDLNLLWSYQMMGHTYYLSPTIYDGYLFVGAYNGCLYVLDKTDGSLVVSEKVYTRTIHDKEYGCVNSPSVIKDGSLYKLAFGFSDGQGMGSNVYGLAMYSFNGSSLTKIVLETDTYGSMSNYMTTFDIDNYKGFYFVSGNGLFMMDLDGKTTLLNSDLAEIHAPAVLVNNEYLYLASYTNGKPNYILDTEGKTLRLMDPPSGVNNYNMSPMTVIGDWVFIGNDSGCYSIYGEFPEYVAPSGGQSIWEILAIVAAVIIAILVIVYVALRFIWKKEKPYQYIGQAIVHFVRGEDYSHNTKSRHRLWIVLAIGIVLILVMFLISLAIGSTSSLSLGETIGVLFSAIGKGGQNLTYEEIVVYNSRLPRTMAALAVGIGLSIAGSVYQAIIRNPLVDPYIMGVSSGAGTAAIAVIAFDFTFFGLFSPHSIYLVAVTAMIGGLLAFFATMLIAEKAGGTSVNYVLAGVVVGLAFSAIQTLMMSMAGHKVTNVLSWLFGSFSNVSWNEVWLIVIPAIVLAFVPLIWAKEFNLVLLGEDQAKQMGLNVRVFNRWMLILASVLTSICVAFVGVIGFVGLVVPHLCRMILGGDHRLVMPMSIVVGALLMMLADFAARMIYFGQELPVGAITTIIGVPVFAYLLIRRGRMYDG